MGTAVTAEDLYNEAEELESCEETTTLEPYEIVSSPNDFNLATLYDFLKQGVVKVPSFQRNYVWDQRRASKLMESILIGLPIPQIFLYEERANSFLVIDGQQRLMSVYYFRTGRFPHMEKRPELRRIYDQNAGIPPEIFENDQYFGTFRLRLPPDASEAPNRLTGLAYADFGDELRRTFDLRTIRNVIIKQVRPREDDSSSVYEIFNRLNTGGVNLRPQEIRSSLYHSAFMDMLGRVNEEDRWRRLFGAAEPDVHMQDIQYLLRSFAILAHGDAYSPSMVRFLDRYSNEARAFGASEVAYLEALFRSFLDACAELPAGAMGFRGKTLSVTVLEAVFWAVCRAVYLRKQVLQGRIHVASLERLRQDEQFIQASTGHTTHTSNVKARLDAAQRVVQPLPAA